MSRASTIKMTARQFLELGEDPVGVRLELVDGEVAVSPSNTPDHAYVIVRLGGLVGGHIEEHELGQAFADVNTIFGDHDVRRPDLLFFSKKRVHLIGEKAMEGPPDLCVEVISPSSVETDRQDKLELYAAGGVANYWIVDPANRTIEGYQLQAKSFVLVRRGRDAEVVRLPPFPELDIPLQQLWRPSV